MYCRGQGVPRSYKEATVWFRKAADQGLAQAQCNLGTIYLQGRSAPKNVANALFWFRKAAAQEFSKVLERVSKLGGMQPPLAGI